MRLLPCLLLFLVLFGAPARADERVALVIGNGAYRSVVALPNPPNDARAVADRLKGLGFDVTLVIDGDKRAMDDAIRSFGRRVPQSDVAMVFYAGHGVQVDGRNYLVPVDARLPQQTQDLRYDFVDVAAVMDELAGARRLRVVVLDACRDNPIAAQLSRSVGRGLGAGRGLAAPTDMDNTLIAYATAADTTAADGDGAHSPFTQALLDHIDDPGLDIRLMFGRVRDEVRRATGNRQNPFVYVSLGGDSVDFNPGPAAPPVVANTPSVLRPTLSDRPLAGLERPITPVPAPALPLVPNLPPVPALPPVPTLPPPPPLPPLPGRPMLSELLAGRWRHADGRGCNSGLFGTVTLLDGALRFEWRLPGGRLNVAIEQITAMDGNGVSTLVISDVGTPRPEVGHRNRYTFEADRWVSESLTTGERSLHVRC